MSGPPTRTCSFRGLRLGHNACVAALFAPVLLLACAYPRLTTPMHAAPGMKVASAETPGAMYTFRLLSAAAPETKISGLSWDDDGSGPDTFVRLYIDDRMVWESPVKEDQAHPEWNMVLPRNVIIGRDSAFRIELWDRDSAVSADPMGQLEHRGLPPTAVPDAIARLAFDTATTVVIMVNAPTPHRGVGLSVEVRGDALKVLEVEPFSPAARAGIKTGEMIKAIGAERVEHMRDNDKMSELSLSAQRRSKLTVADASGKQEREVALDGELLWLVL